MCSFLALSIRAVDDPAVLVVGSVSPVLTNAILRQSIVIHFQHILTLRNDSRHVPPIAVPQVRQCHLLNQSFNACCVAPIARTPISHTTPLIATANPWPKNNMPRIPKNVESTHVLHHVLENTAFALRIAQKSLPAGRPIGLQPIRKFRRLKASNAQFVRLCYRPNKQLFI